MNTCPYCGSENTDGAQTCAVCGSELAVQSFPTTKRRKRKGSTVRTICFVLLAVCLLAGIAFGAVTALSPSAQLNRAVSKTWNSLAQTASEQEDLKYFIDNIDVITSSKKVSLFLETKRGSDSINLQLDYSQPRSALQGAIAFQSGGESGELQFALRKDTLQAKLPNISADVYGLSLKKANNSIAIQFVQDALGVDVSSLFSKDLKDTLNGYVTGICDVWNDFYELVEVELLTKQGDYRVYHVTWSAKDLATLIAGENVKGLGEELLSILEKVDGGCTCYVNHYGHISKVEAVVGADLYTLNFSDQENPWEEVTLSSSLGGATLLRGGVVANASEFRAFLGADQGDSVLDFSYQNSNGAFSLHSGQLSIDGFLHSTKKSSTLQFVDGDGAVIKIEFGRLAKNPQLLSRKYVDIMKMSVGDISALAIKAAANSDRITNGWKIISEFLQSIINGG